jgi:hypothetical protein
MIQRFVCNRFFNLNSRMNTLFLEHGAHNHKHFDHYDKIKIHCRFLRIKKDDQHMAVLDLVCIKKAIQPLSFKNNYAV